MNAQTHIHTQEGIFEKTPTSYMREDPRFYLAMPLRAASSFGVFNTLPTGLDITKDAGKE